MQELKILIKQLIKKVDLCYNKNNSLIGEIKMLNQNNHSNELNIYDIANYIIEQCNQQQINDLTNMKLQKIFFYVFAQYLVENSPNVEELRPLFVDVYFEAWKYGPVLPPLYYTFKNFFDKPLEKLEKEGDESKLTKTENQKVKKIINNIINKYGKWKVYDLSAKTHSEDPWVYTFNLDMLFETTQINNRLIYTFYSAYPLL